jgi:RHS repeat-associated protein
LLLLVAATGSQATETVTYYLTDAQGSVIMTEDAQGNTTGEYDYRPYGSSQSALAPTGPGYTGHVNDPDTGLVYMQQRYYDAGVGQFASVDPIGPTSGNVFSFNRYTYANDNPIRFTDPTGMVSDGDCSAACVFMRRLSDKMSSFADSLLGGAVAGASNAGSSSPTGQLNFANSVSAYGIASTASDAAGDAAPVADMVPGATLAACASGVKCSGGQIAMGVLAAVPLGEGVAAKGAGALSSEITSTFANGEYTATTLTEGMTAYRYSGGVSAASGRFLTDAATMGQISSPVSAGIALNLPLGATAETLNVFTIPAGTTIFTGGVAGGADTALQIFIQNPSVLIPK